MLKSTNIVIIGTGNVAYHIAKSFPEKRDIQLIQVFNHRATKSAKNFAKDFNCELATNYSSIITTADVFIIAVKDDAIVEVVKNLSLLKLKGMVVHTSGSISLDVLKPVSKAIGVYYPLQAFYKNANINWKLTPILIESNSVTSINKLKQIAKSISLTVKEVNSENRLQIHLAAVLACNFTNALYVSAYSIIEKNLSKKDAELLQPIIFQSAQKLQEVHPKLAQTGPAKRNDKLVMNKHLQLLKSDKQLTQVYKLLSELIIDQQKNKI